MLQKKVIMICLEILVENVTGVQTFMIEAVGRLVADLTEHKIIFRVRDNLHLGLAQLQASKRTDLCPV